MLAEQDRSSARRARQITALQMCLLSRISLPLTDRKPLCEMSSHRAEVNKPSVYKLVSCCSINSYYYPGDQICPGEKKCLVHVLTTIPNKGKRESLWFSSLKSGPASISCFLQVLEILSQLFQEQQEQVQQGWTECWPVKQSLGTSIFLCRCLNSTDTV